MICPDLGLLLDLSAVAAYNQCIDWISPALATSVPSLRGGGCFASDLERGQRSGWEETEPERVVSSSEADTLIVD